MNVLSLFDGISCGQVALERSGVIVDKYYASEIDKYAIQVTQTNYPNTIQLGDVRNYRTWIIDNIDLLIGGSPCQDFSTLSTREGLSGKKSGLFYEYVNVLRRYKPKYFMLENNSNMPSSARAEITSLLGVEPIEINSNLVSAQNRKRLYWTNISGIEQPHDRSIVLKDIMISGRDKIQLVPFVEKKIKEIHEKYGYIPQMFNPYNRSEIKDKAPCLTATGNRQTVSCSVIIKLDEGFGMLNALEWERLQTLPDGYTVCLNDEAKRKTVIGNAWTAEVPAHLFKKLGT